MKKIKFTLINKENFYKFLSESTKKSPQKSVDYIEDEIEIPEAIIGVGIISCIDSYMEEHNLDRTAWEISSYVEVR